MAEQRDPLVSVIIPIYNCADVLNETLTSVTTQSHRNLQIVVVNDGSTDNSGDLIDDWARRDPRIHVLHKPNGGESSARNAGTEVAAGELILFVDGDDTISANALETMLLVKQETDAQAVRCGHERELRGGRTQLTSWSTGLHEGRSALGKLAIDIFLGDSHGSACGLLVDTACVRAIPFNESLHYRADALFTVNLLRTLHTVCVIDSPFYRYRLHDVSATQGQDSRKMLNRTVLGTPLLRETLAITPGATQLIKADFEESENRAFWALLLRASSERPFSKGEFLDTRSLLSERLEIGISELVPYSVSMHLGLISRLAKPNYIGNIILNLSGWGYGIFTSMKARRLESGRPSATK